MRKILFPLLVLLTLIGCQNEEDSVTQELDSALTKSAPLSRLLSRVSQNPTHCDNILDGTNCYSVKLPVTITVNDQTFTVNGEADFEAVENNIEASNTDDDIIHFSFPIVIVFPDFHEATIQNQTELDATECTDDDFSEIRCLDFIFPVTINVYNTSNQVANSVTIQSNYQLYHFIKNVTDSQIFAIVFPVSLTLSNGENATANSNDELEDLIEDSIDDCDQDNEGPGPQPPTLEEIISSGVWHISFCEDGDDDDDDDDDDEGGNYQEYNFTFNDNGTITVDKEGVISYGTWDLYLDGSHHKMELSFTDPVLHHLEEDWKVTEYNATNFRLKKDNSGSGGGGHGSNGGNDYVYFTKN